MTKSKGGRPPFYKTPEDLQAAVDRYFDGCRGTPVFDSEGLPVFIRPGVQKIAGETPPTLFGLSHYLGFKDGRQFTRQRSRGTEFNDIVLLAKLRIEEYIVQKLYDPDSYPGAAWRLRTCFGWDTPPEDDETPEVRIVTRTKKNATGSENAPAAHDLKIDLLN